VKRGLRYGLWLAPFGELADARLLAELGARAEAAGWDGLFVWDHVLFGDPGLPIADPWVTLAAVACATESISLGTLVTPVARRHVHKLARETTTLDRLSGGRYILGVGLGSGSRDELGLDETPVDPRERARMLDAGLATLAGCWAGDLQPTPRRARIPVWVGSEWPHRAPLRRAARWDGWFPVGVDRPEDLAEGIAEISRLQAGRARMRFDVVVPGAPDDDSAGWEKAGATWWLVGFGPNPRQGDVRFAIQALRQGR